MERNAPLAPLTTFGIGGPADLLVYPESEQELARWLRSGDVSLVLGGGSNLLVSDKGVRGVVLCLSKMFKAVTFAPPSEGQVIVRAQAGAHLGRIVAEAYKRSLAGLEFAMGIPGTLGGALVMNAGAKDGEMKNVVEHVRVMKRDGQILEMNASDCGFEYRKSSFPEGSVILDCAIRLAEGDKEKIHEKMRSNQLARKASQPLDMQSAGSVFKNPAGDFAGRLIEAAGLKGVSIGGAMVSEKHANFIVNLGWAKASDVLAVMETVEKKVLETAGIRLEREIRLAGAF